MAWARSARRVARSSLGVTAGRGQQPLQVAGGDRPVGGEAALVDQQVAVAAPPVDQVAEAAADGVAGGWVQRGRVGSAGEAEATGGQVDVVQAQPAPACRHRGAVEQHEQADGWLVGVRPVGAGGPPLIQRPLAGGVQHLAAEREAGGGGELSGGVGQDGAGAAGEAEESPQAGETAGAGGRAECGQIRLDVGRSGPAPKLDVNTRAAAVSRAADLGLLQAP